MPCETRYLNSAGIMQREIPGVDALSNAFPKEWLLYVSLNCFPRNQRPMEIDAIVVMDDRVLVLEIKDWNGKLTQDGDLWCINGGSRGRSAVVAVDEKAKKLKTIIRTEIPQLKNVWVDYRVVLTASANNKYLPDSTKHLVWSLHEACAIADPAVRSAVLSRCKLGLLKVYQFEAEFNRLTGNPKLFQPSEADWHGYRVVEQDLFVHPRGAWSEHRAERKGEARLKALLRLWAFHKLPAGLNSPDRRRFVAGRELKAYAHLTDVGSSLIDRNGILREIGANPEEILTQHFELRALPQDWTTLDRFLERARDDLTLADRLVLATTMLSLLRDLHAAGIAHRDVGARCIWIGGITKAALSGLSACQLPDEESMANWLGTLRGYSVNLLLESAVDAIPGQERDVLCAAKLVEQILLLDRPDAAAAVVFLRDEDGLRHVLARANKAARQGGFINAIEFSDEFARASEEITEPPIDQSILDRYETTSVPYLTWPQSELFSSSPRCSVYLSKVRGGEFVVKIWNGISRGVNSAIDLSLIRLLDSVARVVASPVDGLPQYVESGLSPVGPYLVYCHESGVALSEVRGLALRECLNLALRIASSVIALHHLGCHHGDVAPKNILYRKESGDVYLLDAFDMSPVGDGAVHTPAYCPQNWETLSAHQLDRYATLRTIGSVLRAQDDVRLEGVLRTIEGELSRPSVDTLDVAVSEMRRFLRALDTPEVPSFVVQFRDGDRQRFGSDNGNYFFQRVRTGQHWIEYTLTGVDAQLVLRERDGVMYDWRFTNIPFGALSYASFKGISLPLQVSVLSGPDAGIAELYSFLKDRADAAGNMLGAVDAATLSSFDVPRFWKRLMDIEANNRIEIEIVESMGIRDGAVIYEFKNRGRAFEFDIEDVVDVYVSPQKKAGELDLSIADGSTTIAIRGANRRLFAGDTAFLVDRREQTSIDRRTKAINKILDDEAMIPRLIQYFAAHATLPLTDFQATIDDAELAKYRLNKGQEDAFRKLLRHGPVGLLQGPPGTGKTRFIAALVHHLITTLGAQKVLVASQSHEAVNNAIEALIDLYKAFGGRPSLLRIGSKGITEKIRPYHTTELRDRYRIRFEAALKHRVSVLASARGLPREFCAAVVDVDLTLGVLARRCHHLQRIVAGGDEAPAEERDRYSRQLERAQTAFRASANRLLERDVDVTEPLKELEQAYFTLLPKHPDASPADLSLAQSLVKLSRDWMDSMASRHRNFEEFLAKTRSIVAATCVGVGQTRVRVENLTFDWVIVDEAARCTPGELAVPIQLGRRVLLVGDHLQLLPMIKREHLVELEEAEADVEADDFVRSDFERAFMSPYGAMSGQTLTEQYRMDDAICRLVSNCFYEPHSIKLETSPDRTPTLNFPADLPQALRQPLCWIDTSDEPRSRDMRPSNTTTYYNDAEVSTIIRLLETIAARRELTGALAACQQENPIGIICMYSAQKQKLELAFARHAWEARFRRLVRIDTVDSYQGKENAIVVLSLVRSNPERAPGHVATNNRCNVAVSRAQERLIVVGACQMWAKVRSGQPMRRVLEYMHAHPENCTVMKPGALA